MAGLEVWGKLTAVVAMLACAQATPARCAEFQQSPWPRGYYDIFAGFAPPPGVYIRNDLITYEGRTQANAAAGPIDVGYAVAVPRVTVLTPHKIFGAHYGYSLVATVAAVDIGLDIGPVTLSENETGLGDSGLTPALLAWKNGRFNTSLIFTFIAPTGNFDTTELANLGRNHWSFTPQLTFTWYDPDKGWDASAALIYTTSWENEATRYKTGDFVHAEGSVTKAFGPMRFGVAGFAQKQVTGDSGPGAVLGSFKSDVYGVGPLAGLTLGGAGEELPLFLNAKWLREFGARNAPEGDIFTVNALFKF